MKNPKRSFHLTPGLWVAVVLSLVACEESVEPLSIQVDQQAPAVTAVTPAADAVLVPVGTTVNVAFSEVMDAARITPMTFVVKVNGAPQEGSIVRAADGQTFSFVPSSGRLPANGNAEVTIAPSVTDIAGNALGDPYTWEFTTARLPGSPANPEPADGAQDQAWTVELRWEVFELASGTFDLWLGREGEPLAELVAGTEEATFRTDRLDGNTTYKWQVVHHASGMQFTGPTWTFTTASEDPDNHPPDAPSDPNPDDGRIGVSIQTQLSWAANDIDGDVLEFEVFFGESDDPPSVGTATDTDFDLGRQLQHSKRYFWRVAVDDGRSLQPTLGPVWSFVTALPNTPPSQPSNPNPSHNASDVPLDVELRWDASDDVDGDQVTYDLRFGTSTSPGAEVRGLTVSRATPPVALEPGERYFWQVVARDPSSHTDGPIWTFVADDNVAPHRPESPTPADEAEGVARNPVLRWEHAGDPNGDTVSFDVFFGEGDDPPLVVTTHNNQHQVFDLDFETEYSWRVVARDPGGLATAGRTWTFETVEMTSQPPSAPCLPSPGNGMLLTGGVVGFSWQCGLDPDGTQVHYEVYVGRSPIPNVLVETTSPGVREAAPIGVSAGPWFWQIVAIDEDGQSTRGPVWQFTVSN